MSDLAHARAMASVTIIFDQFKQIRLVLQADLPRAEKPTPSLNNLFIQLGLSRSVQCNALSYESTLRERPR